MANTRLMDRLFSATNENDADLTAQVAQDIEAAHEAPVETEELVFEDAGDGRVAITDKENGEVTIAEKAEDGNYDLSPWMEPSEQLEKFIHPEGDGVTPGQQVGEEDEEHEDHLAGAEVSDIPEHEIAEEVAEEGVCPECGQVECECEEGEAREFSVATDNVIVQRIFSDQEYMERIFAEVIDSEECAKIGDIKVEKIEGEDAVIVTSESTGDQARVELDEDNMEVTELDAKTFSEMYEYVDDYRYFSEEAEGDSVNEEQYEPLHVVGVDSFNHELIDAPEYDPESAEDLAARLTEDGVDAVQIFDNEEEARGYALDLLENLGAEDAEEPEEKEFSDHTIYVTRYYSNNTFLMDKMFSEACNEVETSQAKIEDAIESGEEIETEDEIVTPIDAVSAVIEDKESGEFTKVTLEGDTMNCDSISEDEAEDLMDHIAVSDDEHDEDEDDERWDDDYRERTRTDFDEREFSYYDDDDDDVEYDEYGNEITRDGNGDVIPMHSWESAKQAETRVRGENFKKHQGDWDDEDWYSDVYSNDDETKFFSENEYMTDYMVRLFSDEASESEIESAIEEGEQIENDTEVITPIDATTAVIEDKENGEFTKAVMNDDDIDITPISEEEADELTDHLAVEDDENDENEDEEKEFSEPSTLDKFFAQAGLGAAPIAPAPIAPAPAPVAPVDAAGVPVDPAMVDPAMDPAMAPVPAPVPTVEMIEDKAVAAVQQIQAAAAEAEAQIMNAKAAPAQMAEPDLQEAQFSENDEDAEERTFSDTLVTWLDNNLG